MIFYHTSRRAARAGSGSNDSGPAMEYGVMIGPVGGVTAGSGSPVVSLTGAQFQNVTVLGHPRRA
jgi:hypothetical protein